MPSYATAAWLTCLLATASGCGDRTALGEATRASTDSGVDAFDASAGGVLRPIDAAFDSGVACGPMECAPGSICVTTVSGAGPCMGLPLDGGPCPPGTLFFGDCCPAVAYECRAMPTDCIPMNECGCPQLCPNYCECYVPLSPQFLCDCVET